MIKEELESYDELLRKRQDLRKGWYIERRDETKLLTSLGEICYSRTYFHNNRGILLSVRSSHGLGIACPYFIGCRSQNTGGGCGKQLPERRNQCLYRGTGGKQGNRNE